MELVFRMLDTELDIPLDEWTRELLLLQYQRAEAGEDVAAFRNEFARKVQNIVRYGNIDDFRTPTEKQTLYAARICAELNLPLYPEILRYRGLMSEFLARYSPVFLKQGRAEASLPDPAVDGTSDG